jgi:hypothetical protein
VEFSLRCSCQNSVYNCHLQYLLQTVKLFYPHSLIVTICKGFTLWNSSLYAVLHFCSDTVNVKHYSHFGQRTNASIFRIISVPQPTHIHVSCNNFKGICPCCPRWCLCHGGALSTDYLLLISQFLGSQTLYHRIIARHIHCVDSSMFSLLIIVLPAFTRIRKIA